MLDVLHSNTLFGCFFSFPFLVLLLVPALP